MKEEYQSFSERWMREYERKHPEVLVRVKQQNSDDYIKEDSQLYFESGTSMPSKKPDNACLWNGVAEGSLPHDKEPTEIDYLVRAARETRLRLRFSQVEFANRLGISFRTLGEWEQGRRRPTAAARQLLLWIIEDPDRL